MIRTKKLTPLAFGYRITSRRPPQPELALIMRAKLVCAPGKPCELVRVTLDPSDTRELDPVAAEVLEEGEYLVGQGALTADAFEDDDDMRAGQVVYPNDFAEFKPKAEITVRAHCHPPGGRAKECAVGIEVMSSDGGKRLAKALAAVGPRVWVDRLLGGKHTEPLEFESLPVDYRHSYGGPEHEANPVGMGHEMERLASVEDPRFPAAAGPPPFPPGFGPINPEWPFRRLKVGKNWGEQYERERAPWYASDYDWTHQNAAPPDQQIDGFWRGDEQLRFVNLHPESNAFTVQLPGLRPRAFIEMKNGKRSEIRVVCDTIFADLLDGVVYLTWRGHAPVKEDDLSDVAYLLLAHEEANDAPLPASHYLAQLEEFAADPIGLGKTPVATLQKFETELESGELERRLDELPEDADPVVAVFGDLISLGHEPEQIKKSIKEQSDKANERDPNARKAVIASLKETLRDMREGGGGGGGGMTVDTQSGDANAGPLMRSILGQVAQMQQRATEAGADISHTNEALEEALAKADIPGAQAEDLKVPDANAPLPEPVPGADFSGHDLKDRDFAGLDLHGCIFDGANLTRTKLAKANLQGASFLGAALNATDLREADCREANFTMARFAKTRAQGADLSRASLDQCAMFKCDLSGAKLHGVSGKLIMAHRAILDGIDAEGAIFEKASFDEMSMAGASFKKATLPYTLFRKVDLCEARFDGANLANTAFFECDLGRSVFRGARGDTTNFKDTKLRDADVRYATFPSSIFMGVDAVRARFDACDMPQARFYRAALREATFDEANLFKADMRKASMKQARFVGANLYGAAFIEAYGTDVDFKDANLGMSNFKRNKLVIR